MMAAQPWLHGRVRPRDPRREPVAMVAPTTLTGDEDYGLSLARDRGRAQAAWLMRPAAWMQAHAAARAKAFGGGRQAP
jgi:hypothetical protein